MSQIDLSAAWIAAVMPAILTCGNSGQYDWGGYSFNNSTTSVAANAGLLCTGQGSSSACTGQIRLMSGTPASLPNITNENAVAAQVLCTFSAAGGLSSGDFVTSQVTTNPAIISTQYVNATATGTATWFWWAVIPNQGSGYYNPAATPLHQIIGTVGAPGSGADLIMASTSVVAGQPYRIINLQLSIPTTWNY